MFTSYIKESFACLCGCYHEKTYFCSYTHDSAQARIHTGFHRFTEIGQNFHNKKKSIDMYIFVIKVNCKLNLEVLTFIFYLFFFANYRK